MKKKIPLPLLTEKTPYVKAMRKHPIATLYLLTLRRSIPSSILLKRKEVMTLPLPPWCDQWDIERKLYEETPPLNPSPCLT